ncbi:hypothetical protein H101_07637 [Trichophyton interdigitale H6]|nr:hypothetical protein H101_07637 [Trichophyton interdigitale H6]
MTSSSIQQSVEPRALVEVPTMVRRWDISQGIDANLADLAATALRPLAIETSSNPGTSGTYFPFRPLEKIPAAADAVNAWIENRSNIERAGINLKDNTTVKPRSYLSTWCPIVINTMPRAGILRGIAPDKNGQAIIIAAPHKLILAEQVVELLELNAEHADSPMIKYTANDGTIKTGQCSWDQFMRMPRALEIYRRDGGESLNPKVKLMIALYGILGKQAWTHWFGRRVVEGPDTVGQIKEYQGVIFGTATGLRPTVLAIALVKGKYVQVVFPSITNLPPEDQHFARDWAAEASKLAHTCDSYNRIFVLFRPGQA